MARKPPVLFTYYVYIISNKYRTTFYVGVTNNLERRMREHHERIIDGFSKKYWLTDLVYYEETDDVGVAIGREKQLKRWHRDWKINLIRLMNPRMEDLSAGWFE